MLAMASSFASKRFAFVEFRNNAQDCCCPPLHIVWTIHCVRVFCHPFHNSFLSIPCSWQILLTFAAVHFPLVRALRAVAIGSFRKNQMAGMVNQFQTDPTYFCFLLSTRAAGVGLNLTAASNVVYVKDQISLQDVYNIRKSFLTHLYCFSSEVYLTPSGIPQMISKPKIAAFALVKRVTCVCTD